jgi:hypothetical protein
MNRLGSVLCLLAATVFAASFLLVVFTKLTSGNVLAYSLMVVFAAGVVFFYWLAGRVGRPARRTSL